MLPLQSVWSGFRLPALLQSATTNKETRSPTPTVQLLQQVMAEVDNPATIGLCKGSRYFFQKFQELPKRKVDCLFHFAACDQYVFRG